MAAQKSNNYHCARMFAKPHSTISKKFDIEKSQGA
jgi:hypothetical protein